MEAYSYHRDGGRSASDYSKLTYNSSLYESNSKPKCNKEIAVGFAAETETEAEGDGVDLDLKL